MFDKTGTLTAGAPRVTRVLATERTTYTPERVLAVAASGELHSQHPLASAVLRHTAERELEIPPHSEYEIIVGHGVRFAVDGTRLVIGSQPHAGRLRRPRAARDRGRRPAACASAARPCSGWPRPRRRPAPPAEHAVRQHPEGEAEPEAAAEPGTPDGGPPPGGRRRPRRRRGWPARRSRRRAGARAGGRAGPGGGPDRGGGRGAAGGGGGPRLPARAGVGQIHMITGDSREGGRRWWPSSWGPAPARHRRGPAGREVRPWCAASRRAGRTGGPGGGRGQRRPGPGGGGRGDRHGPRRGGRGPRGGGHRPGRGRHPAGGRGDRASPGARWPWCARTSPPAWGSTGWASWPGPWGSSPPSPPPWCTT